MDPIPPAVARYLAAYNALDVDAMLDCLAGDVRFENVSAGTVTVRSDGRDAFRQLAEQGAAAFSQREQRPTACIAAGDRVALRIAYRATVRSDLPNGWKAGDEIALTGASFFRLAGDGAIAEIVDIV